MPELYKVTAYPPKGAAKVNMIAARTPSEARRLARAWAFSVGAESYDVDG